MHKVELQSTHTVFNKHNFKIEESALRFEKFNGEMSDTVQRLVFERGDSAAALLLNRDTQKVILIKQFRYPTYQKQPGWLCEVVAGSISEGEQPEESIKREIREEVGYEAQNLTSVATFYTSPGGCSERIWLYYAEVSVADRINNGGGLASEHEDIEQVELSLPELWQTIERGEIMDAKTLIALQWLRLRRGEK
ncbi:NUDIX domain-containing protein [Ktedonospora formicarum]|uniref:ADP-ribose diphosphatase n=1 Tax=Ktedonospora formicarum TaxID=2778364 RepID=A0A8J3MU25_9CHLR|nr:NUDIX hydrolase [Ktedonospora formicarum]GHO46198.1 ADP-ribose diphosphatase [Ktedonospora formicarum]